jgi:hypothetical protein
MSANAEMIRLYWGIGQMVAKRQRLEGWGKGLLRRLAIDLKDEIPEIKGLESWSNTSRPLLTTLKWNASSCRPGKRHQHMEDPACRVGSRLK